MAKMIKMNYIPEMLFTEIHSMSQLTAFPYEGSFELLRQMTDKELPDTNGLYGKLWMRLDLQFDKIYSSRCAQMIEVIAKFHEKHPSEENLERMKKYLLKYRQIINSN